MKCSQIGAEILLVVHLEVIQCDAFHRLGRTERRVRQDAVLAVHEFIENCAGDGIRLAGLLFDAVEGSRFQALKLGGIPAWLQQNLSG